MFNTADSFARTANALAAKRLETDIVVETGEWKNKCQSILVLENTDRSRKSAQAGSARFKRDLDGAARNLSRSFPMNLMSGARRRSSSAPSAAATSSAITSGGGAGRRLQWANLAQVASASNCVPRRLSLQEKVELYSRRPDLDLAGIMQRLEAIKRLEAMSVLQTAQRNRSMASSSQPSGSSIGQFYAFQASEHDDDDDDSDLDLGEAEESKYDEAPDLDVEMVDEFKHDGKREETVKRSNQEEEERFFDALSASRHAEFKQSHTEASSSSSPASRFEQHQANTTGASLIPRKPTPRTGSINAEYRSYWLQNRQTA